MAVNTKKVKVRRLSFTTLEQGLAEIERLAAAERAGKLTRLGNWETGQVFGHIAWWIDGGFDGVDIRTPWYIRLLLPLMKKKMLNSAPMQGFRLPGAPEGTYGTERLSLDEGLQRVRKAIARLQAGTPTIPNEAFGRLTREEWIKLHLRHMEGHLGYLVAEGDRV